LTLKTGFAVVIKEWWDKVMEAVTLHTDITEADAEEISIFYNKTFSDSLYGIECYIAGTDYEKKHNYWHERNITPNEEFIDQLIDKFAKGNVFPIHIAEIVADCYPCFGSRFK